MEKAALIVVSSSVGIVLAYSYYQECRSRRIKEAAAHLRKLLPLNAPVGNTALWVCSARAHESTRADRLIVDPYAESLAGAEGKQIYDFMNSLRGATFPSWLPFSKQLNRFFSMDMAIGLRTRFFDDELLKAVNAQTIIEPGVRQVVILGAGLDSRALRLPWPDTTVVYEVDRAEVLQFKSRKLEAFIEGQQSMRESASLMTHVSEKRTGARRVPVEADLADESWATLLQRAGFNPAEPVVWLCEGLLMYLDRPNANKLVSKMWDLSPVGSMMMCDTFSKKSAYASTHIVLRVMEEQGMRFDFSCDDPRAFLQSNKWTPIESLTYKEISRRYNVWNPVMTCFWPWGGSAHLSTARKT